MSRPLNILCLHPVLSMRAVKEMAALAQRGHNIVLAYESVGSSASADEGEFWKEVFAAPPAGNKWKFVLRRIFPGQYREFLRSIVRAENIDLVHAFSMPDHLAVAAIKFAGVPVVYDVRDLTTGMDPQPLWVTRSSLLNRVQSALRRKVEARFESFACRFAQGVVCVTKEMAETVQKFYGVPSGRLIHLESYPLRSTVPDESLVKRREGPPGALGEHEPVRLVYAGNLFWDGYDATFSFLDSLKGRGVVLHLYPTKKDDSFYSLEECFRGATHIKFHEPRRQADLFRAFKDYEFGLVLYSPDKCTLNRRLTISNKLLEYLACGIPVACTDLEAPRKFLERCQGGFVFSSPDELVEKAKKLRGRFRILQEQFFMENHIHKLLDLYSVVLGRSVV